MISGKSVLPVLHLNLCRKGSHKKLTSVNFSTFFHQNCLEELSYSCIDMWILEKIDFMFFVFLFESKY